MKKTLFVAEVAVFSALVFVATIVVAIPSVSTSGYINFGDVVIFISSAFLGPFGGFVAGGVGSMLADLMYSPVWMPVTFIVKGLEGVIAGVVFVLLKNAFKTKKFGLPVATALAFVLSAVEMVVGYYIGGAIILGLSSGDWSVAFTSSALDIPGNCLQGGVSVLVGGAITLLLCKIPYTKNLMEKNLSVFKKRANKSACEDVADAESENLTE